MTVKDFGATGDGVTDDTVAILRAVANGVSYVPAGTYKVAKLTLPAGAVLVGEGPASYISGNVHCSSGARLSNLKVGAAGAPFEIEDGTSGCVLDHITFTGGGGGNPDDSGVVEMDGTPSDVLFTDCTIETNADGVGDGVKIVLNDPAADLHDVTFERCRFESQPRMGFECVNISPGASQTPVFHHISLIDCTFAVQGAESVSFAGPGRDLLVEGCTFKGSGSNSAYPWHQTLELKNISNSKVIDNTFGRGTGWWLNCIADGCVFADNVFDSTLDEVGKPADKDAQAWGGTYTGCTFSNNTVRMDTGAGFFWFSESSRNRFTANSFTDLRDPNPYSGYFVKGSRNNTFVGTTFATRSDPVLIFKDGSSGNTFVNTTWQVPGKRFSVESGSSVSDH